MEVRLFKNVFMKLRPVLLRETRQHSAGWQPDICVGLRFLSQFQSPLAWVDRSRS
jgi:hypothetical protein